MPRDPFLAKKPSPGRRGGRKPVAKQWRAQDRNPEARGTIGLFCRVAAKTLLPRNTLQIFMKILINFILFYGQTCSNLL